MNIPGGCICGAVRYQLTAEPLFTHVCHCTECQHESGSAFQITALVLASDFKLVGNEPSVNYVTRKSGNEYAIYRCENCCCTVAAKSIPENRVMVVRPGTFDDTSIVWPQAHIWAREKQSWFEIPTGVPVFEEEYDHKQLWPRASLELVYEQE